MIAELSTDAPVTVVHGPQSQQLWRDIRDVRCFAASTKPLWRLLLPPSRAALVATEISQNLPCSVLFDRAGALVWLQCLGDDPGESWVRSAASHVQGQATLFRASPQLRSAVAPFHPESPAVGKLSEQIKLAFDPLGLLEPSRMVRGR